MNKKAIFAGAFLSIFLHLLLGLNTFRPTKILKPETSAKTEKAPVTVVMPRIQEESKVSPSEREESPSLSAKADSLAPQPDPQLKKLFEATKSLEHIEEKKGELAEGKEARDILPELRIDISAPEIIIGAIGCLGMRVAIVASHSQAILGEVKFDSGAKMAPFSGKLINYSNRVRLLPQDYFGEELARFLKENKAQFFLLVPAHLDREFAELQRKKITRSGYRMNEVRATEAQFIKTGERYSLSLTGIVSK